MKNNDRLKIKNILVFKLCCLGDIVMMTPSINALKRNFPDARITIIVNSWVRGITEYLNNIDSVIISDALYEKSLAGKLAGAASLISELRKGKFDLVLLGHRNNIFGLITKLAGIKYRLGFCGTKFLTNCENFRDDIHEPKRYLRILKSIGIEDYENIPKLKKIEKRENILTESGIDHRKKVVAIFPFGGVNPGTEMNIKRWELQKFIELTSRISIAYPEIEILFLEGTESSEKITDRKFSDNVKIRKIDTGLISACDMMIGIDTGAVHIAAAFGIPTLTIFGPSDPDLIAPLNPSGQNIHEVISKNVECSPCYNTATAIDKGNKKYWQGNKFICYKGTNECMKLISVDEVFDRVSRKIAGTGK